jgi:hypothetical protein
MSMNKIFMLAILMLTPILPAHAAWWPWSKSIDAIKISIEQTTPAVLQKAKPNIVAQTVTKGFDALTATAEVGESIIKGASSLAWYAPRVTALAALGAVGYIYRKEIKEKIEEHKELLLKVAKGAAGLSAGAATAYAAYKAYQAWNSGSADARAAAYKAYKKSAPITFDTQSIKPLPAEAVKSIVIDDYKEWNALWDQFEQERAVTTAVAPIVQTIIDQKPAIQKSDIADAVLENAWQEAKHMPEIIKPEPQLMGIESKVSQEPVTAFAAHQPDLKAAQDRIAHLSLGVNNNVIPVAASPIDKEHSWVSEFNAKENTDASKEWIKEFKTDLRNQKQESKLLKQDEKAVATSDTTTRIDSEDSNRRARNLADWSNTPSLDRVRQLVNHITGIDNVKSISE